MNYRQASRWLLAGLFMLLSAGVGHAAGTGVIDIDVTTHLGDRQVFHEGDELAFLITLEQDAWLTAVYVDADNNLVQVLPNKKRQDSFFRARLFIPFPAQNAGFSFRVQPPFGEEALWLFASDQPPPEQPGQLLENGLKLLRDDIDTVRQRVRDAAETAWGEARVRVVTRASDDPR